MKTIPVRKNFCGRVFLYKKYDILFYITVRVRYFAPRVPAWPGRFYGIRHVSVSADATVLPDKPFSPLHGKGKITVKHRSCIALLLAALLVFSGCAELVDPAYLADLPAELQPLAEFAHAANSVAAPESGSIATEGGISYVSNELILVLAADVSQQTVQTLASKFGFAVAGSVEIANTVQFRSSQRYSLQELISLSGTISTYKEVVFAGVNYITPVVLQTGSGSGTRSWGAEAIGAPWFRENTPSGLSPVRAGVISTMFDAAHPSVQFARIHDNDVYFETDKDLGDASEGTFVAGILAGTGTGEYAEGIASGYELVGMSCGQTAEGISAVKLISMLASLVSYGVRVVDVDIGYTEEHIARLAAEETSAQTAFRSDTQLCAAAMSAFLAKGRDLLLVCPAGKDARYNSPFCGFKEKNLRERVLIVGAASDGSFAVSACSAQNPDVFAPGENVYGCISRDEYAYRTGTGAAAAYAAGVCVLVQSMHSGFTGSEVRRWVIESADLPVSGSEKGMVDLRAAAEKTEFDSPFVVGNTVTMGTWGGEPVEWLVVDEENDGVFVLVSVKGIDAIPFHADEIYITWAKCTLRGWLNRSFYNSAFSADEKKWIIQSRVSNGTEPTLGVDMGEDTQDYLYLPDLEDLKKYFGADAYNKSNCEALLCLAGPAAIEHNAWTITQEDVDRNASNFSYPLQAGSCWWWLRIPGIDRSGAFIITVAGELSLSTRLPNIARGTAGCVRPLMRVKPE